MHPTQNEETRLRLALGNALHQINALYETHGEDLARDEAGIIAIRTTLSNTLKEKITPVDSKSHQLATMLIVLIHGICFACVLFGFLIKG